jgi:integrase
MESMERKRPPAAPLVNAGVQGRIVELCQRGDRVGGPGRPRLPPDRDRGARLGQAGRARCGHPRRRRLDRRAWTKARQTALTTAEQASPLARRPHHLRDACLSTWLNGGVYPTQVAEWAGHSVDVLLRIY